MAAHPWLIVIVVNKILPLWMGFFYAFSVTFLRKNPHFSRRKYFT